MKYRSDIDGLRAVAVLPVIMFHAGVTAMAGGYVGVDVFFVISGYLITGIMRSEIEEGRFSILNFYARRIRRILPALTFTVLLTVIVALLLFLPVYLVDFGRSLVFTAAFLSNLYFYKSSGYFENSALLRPLLHTWSLAVEEQYYIVMPLAVWLVHHYGNKRWRIVFGLAALASFALSLFLTTRGPTANFFLLPTRAWELLLGALLVLTPPPPIKTYLFNTILSVIGIALIIWPVLAYTDATPFPGLAATPPCFGAAILIYTGRHNRSLINSALGWTPLVFVGQISYSLYLVHWPITVFARYATLRRPDFFGVTFILMLSLLLAAFSWRWIERPFRNRNLLSSRLQLFGTAVGVLVAVAAIGATLIATRGLPQRIPAAKRLLAHSSVADPGDGQGWRNGVCFFLDVKHVSNWSKRNCAITRAAPQKALLWGDSFAAHYTQGIEANADKIPYEIYLYTMAGCPPVLSYYSFARPACQSFNRRAIDIVRREGIKTVVLSSRWDDLRSRGIDQLGSTLTALNALGVQTYVIGQSPDFLVNADIIAFLKAGPRVRSVDRWVDSVDPKLNQNLMRVVGRDHSFTDPLRALCIHDECAYRVNGHLLFYDAGHLTPFGSNYAVRLYFPLYHP